MDDTSFFIKTLGILPWLSIFFTITFLIVIVCVEEKYEEKDSTLYNCLCKEKGYDYYLEDNNDNEYCVKNEKLYSIKIIDNKIYGI